MNASLPPPGSGPLAGTRIGVTAGRNGAALDRALQEMGAVVHCGPTVEMVATPVERVRAETAAALDAAPAWVVVTTADGFGRWLEVSGPLRPLVEDLLERVQVAARGQKAETACESHGLAPNVTPPSERGAELARLLAERSVPGTRVLVQADGGGSPAVIADLAAAGFDCRSVHPYRWAIPEDSSRGRELVTRTVEGGIDIVTFSSPPAVRGLFEVAADAGLGGSLAEALRHGVRVAAIGPATAEAAESAGVPVSICPGRPRVDALVGAIVASRDVTAAPVLRLDPVARLVTSENRTVALTDLEFFLLASLARRQGVTCATDVLLREIWGDGAGRRRLEVLVSRLRSRLTDLELSICAVPKRGYRLERAV